MSPDAVGLSDLDPVIHAPKRLAIMSVLAHAGGTDFVFLKRHLGTSDSDLSKQMAALEQAGYVTINKHGRGRGAVTTYKITASGTRAYQRHRAALQALLGE